jgi:hypothetical protein
MDWMVTSGRRGGKPGTGLSGRSQAGMPVHPEWYSDEFGRLLKRAGLRRITLHDSRHTTLTLMEHAGVPISLVSKWAGHYDSARPACLQPGQWRLQTVNNHRAADVIPSAPNAEPGRLGNRAPLWLAGRRLTYVCPAVPVAGVPAIA